MICTKCNDDKDVDEFGNDKTRPSGKFPWCKSCTKRHRTRYNNDPTETTKTCGKCKKQKHPEEFYKNRAQKDGLKPWCKKCSSSSGAINYRGSRNKDKYLQSRYGLSLEGYGVLFESQDGRCAICKKEPTNTALCVDHDHETGNIRGLLCKNCNVGIGNLMDNVDILKSAIEYLGMHNGRR